MLHYKRKRIAGCLAIALILIAGILPYMLSKKTPAFEEDHRTVWMIPEIVPRRDWESIITGVDVKKELDSWKKGEKHAILVATSELLKLGKYGEEVFQKVALNQETYCMNMTGKSGKSYTLLYLNYGDVLQDTCVIQNERGYYSLYGFRKEDSTKIVVTNKEKHEWKEVKIPSKTNPWHEGEGIEIPDGEVFKKEVIVDGMDQVIGTMYTTTLITDE